ncbi:ABC transporter ATP-binding protein [Anaerotalea alkaliphila]|uniref:ABC transporter ATP-binding protein n=1 Tax=Anaerotalea alkaliphila TaxID=2662126 RepID=A0A7X5HVR3_9FIRM|nr:ABC transporter ATP-binding protein [Anaerotalea alkaliphila]NDL67468.1 ABC transporter ATP-binding protein [Anaerotalea alkaliphila]
MEEATKRNTHCVIVEHVDRSYGRKQVLFDISLRLGHAQILGLLGPSGSGKTTLIRLVAGIDRPDRGVVHLLGERLPRLSMMGRIGYMAQADALYGDLTARENMGFFASMYPLGRSRKKERIQVVLDLLGLTPDADRLVREYSGGMKRRLSLGIALLHQPPVLILDEPTIGLDPLLRQTIWEELYRQKDAGVTIIISTHAMDEAEKCDTLGMLREGRLIGSGSPGEVKAAADAQTIEEAFIRLGGGGL